MALKDLSLAIKKTKKVENVGTVCMEVNPDAEIACGIIDDMFGEIAESISKKKSTYNINMLARGFIQNLVLKNDTKEGVKNFLRGMYQDDINRLMIKIEKRMEERAKRQA